MSAQRLRDRWRGELQPLAREAAARLVLGTPLHDLGLGEVDGRVDLRGLWLASTRELRGLGAADRLATNPTATGVSWRDLDLSHSTVHVDLADAIVVNVRFDRVVWPDWRASSSRFVDCSFRGADVRHASFDGSNDGLQGSGPIVPTSTYLRCDFTRTRTGRYGGFGRAIFEECLFADTRFPSPVWLRGAQIRRCTFTGTFRTVCFGWTGPVNEVAPWLEADVSQATFESLEVYAHTGPGL